MQPEHLAGSEHFLVYWSKVGEIQSAGSDTALVLVWDASVITVDLISGKNHVG